MAMIPWTPEEARREGERVYAQRGAEIVYQREAAEDAYRVHHNIPHPDAASGLARLATRLGMTAEQVEALDEAELLRQIEDADEAECITDEHTAGLR